MTPVVTIVDYGVGNLFSVARALERCGAEARFARSAEAILAADCLLLPGVGAFGNGIAKECEPLNEVFTRSCSSGVEADRLSPRNSGSASLCAFRAAT